MAELTIVMPVYNEEEIISVVVEDWVPHLRRLGVGFCLSLYNDGSVDKSLEVMKDLEARYSEVLVVDQPNSGHGPTILKGYREAASEWIFQVDSDNEMSPKYFFRLWDERHGYDLLLGRRVDRIQSLSRKLLSRVSRILVSRLFAPGVSDANAPYRLMRGKCFASIYERIPGNTFAPNLMVSGLAARENVRIHEVDVPVSLRQTGEFSLQNIKLFRAAILSFWQTLKMAMRR